MAVQDKRLRQYQVKEYAGPFSEMPSKLPFGDYYFDEENQDLYKYNYNEVPILIGNNGSDGPTIYTSDGSIVGSNRTVTMNDLGDNDYLFKIEAIGSSNKESSIQVHSEDILLKSNFNGQVGIEITDTEDNTTFLSSSGLQVTNSDSKLLHEVGDGTGNTISESSININGQGIVVLDTTSNKGIEYAADYSANWGPRNLVDKAYVDSKSSDGAGDMLKSVYDPNGVESDAFDMDNMSQGISKQFISTSDRALLDNTTGTNSGDQDVSGITTNASNISSNASAIALNTNKVGITPTQASNIITNNSKISYTDSAAVSLNTDKNSYPNGDALKLSGIESGAQVNVKADWNATSGDAEILNKPTINNSFSGDYNDLTNKPTTITVGQASEIAANTLKISYDDASAVALNTAKVGITTQQASDITSNNDKISYTDASDVAANTLKNSYPSADATKLSNIEDNAQVNVQADWNATSGDALILNKPNIPIAFSGDYNDLSNKPVVVNGTSLEIGDNSITNTKVNGSLALGTDTAFQKLHIVDGNALLQAGGEIALIMKRDVTFTNSHSNSPFENPIFQIGRIIQGGDGAPQFRWMYSDDNTSETVVMELDSEGIMSSVRQERGSHFEAHIEGEANPFFRLNSNPDMRLEMGAGGNDTTDVAVCRSGVETLSICVGSGVNEEQIVNIKSTGAEYSQDYSANYTDRSLIDKAHLDSKLFTEKSFTINDPINEIIPLFVLGQSITISELRVAKVGSGDVEYKLGFGSSLGTIDTDITTNQTQSLSSSTLINSFSNDTISADEFVFLQIVNANSATQFHITIKYN